MYRDPSATDPRRGARRLDSEGPTQQLAEGTIRTMTSRPGRRVRPIDPDARDRQQQEVFDRIALSRGRVSGPFTVLLEVPILADRVQHLGAYLRYETQLGRDLAEAAILATAHAWDSPFEWEEHQPLAREAGVPLDVIEALRAGGSTDSMAPPFRIVCNYARELATSGHVTDAVHGSAMELLGLARTIELTVLVGYYAMLAMTLNAHGIAGPGGPGPAQAASGQG